jgi:predicted Zn-dependent peptidase
MRYHLKKLPNGLRLLTVPLPQTETVTVLVLVGTGSKYEEKAKNGLSHFLEHMCFKGTTTRKTAKDIASELDALGSQSNAFTSHEYTGYYAKGDRKKFKELFDIVSDIYLHPTFPEAEIEKEKGVIVEEINMYEDMPHRSIFEVFSTLLYGDQPAGWPIAGSKETVGGMTREDFVQYHDSQYVPSNTVIVVSGNIDERSTLQITRKYFGPLKKGRAKQQLKIVEKQTEPGVLLKHKTTDQSHFMLGFRTYGKGHKDNMILSIIATLLGGGMSSRLFIKLREDLGAAYYVDADNDVSADHGVFYIRAGVTNTKIETVLGEIGKEIKVLTEESVTDRELEKVKSYLLGNLKLYLEPSDDIANFFGRQAIVGEKIKNVADIEKEILAITEKDIKRVAKKIFTKKTLNLGIVGPFTEKKPFQEVLVQFP